MQQSEDSPAKAVQLVIWDLEGIFWHGKLGEGGITPRPVAAAVVRKLARRGIISSVCSKNETLKARATLIRQKLWRFFVFPDISMEEKGPRLGALIAATQMRPQSVLFIDDDPLNRAEAQKFVPGIQVGDSGIVNDLLADPRMIGNPDPELTQLARYRVLSKRAEGFKRPVMRKLYSDESVEITHRPGDGTHAIISFAGIGFGDGNIQITEFHKSLSGSPNDLYFVIDKSRSWYNENFTKIRDLINTDLTRRNIARVSTIGNSMGGFGALIFASQFSGCRAAMAFTPQSTVDPSIVPWESRYLNLIQQVSVWNGLDATKSLSPDIRYDVFYGNSNSWDLQHASRLSACAHKSLRIHIIPQAGHEVATYLKKTGALNAIIQKLLLCEEGDFDIEGLLPGADKDPSSTVTE